MQKNFYREADISLIEKYNKEIDARIDEIENYPKGLEVEGARYYVSSSMGDDKNDGLSPETPWKSMDKVNAFNFNSGDGVYLKRGDEWRIVVPVKARSGMRISAYGEGKKPKLICSVDASGAESWAETDVKDVYRYTGIIGGFAHNVGTIIFDGGRAWGIHVSKLSIDENREKYKAGEEYRLDNGTVFNGLETYTTPYGPFSGYKDLKGNLEFYHDMASEELFLMCKGGNPGEVFKSIELVDYGHGIQLVSDTKTPRDMIYHCAKNIIIDNIEIFGTGSHGIGGGNFEDITVQYCTFRWIGGSVQGKNTGANGAYIRFGNAIESYGYSQNFIMHHNYAWGVYDCCWTAQCGGAVRFDNVQSHHNVAEFSNTGTEIWVKDGGYVTGLKVYDNFDRYIGYGWSHQRPSGDSVRNKNGAGWIGAGGFFYAATNNEMNCENNDVMNNVYMFAGSISNNVPAAIPDKFNFHDNVYIMEDGKRAGSYPLSPFRGEYNEENIAKGLESGAENGTVFYHIKPNPLGDMYKLCLPKNK